MAKHARGADESKVNLQQTLSQALVYLKYWRLAILLMAFALTIGMSYYVYGRSVYYSKALVDYKVLDLPVDEDVMTPTLSQMPSWYKERLLLEHFNSQYLATRTATRLGLTATGAEFSAVRSDFLQKFNVTRVDPHTIMIEVWPFTAELAKTWPKAMVDEFVEYRAQLRREYRDRGLERYREELAEIRGKIDESTASRVDFEKENAYIETFIEQNKYTELPREMIRTKHRLELAEQIRPQIESDAVGSTEKLALITEFENQEDLQIAPLTRRASSADPLEARGSAPAIFERKIVLMSPDSEGLENWQDLEKERRRLEEEVVKNEATYLPEHRVMVELHGKLADVTEGLERELQLAIERFHLECITLRNRLDALEAKLPEYNEITKKYDGFRKNYDILAKGDNVWSEAQVELATKVAKMEFGADKWRVELRFLGLLSLREDPVSPNKTKLIYIALALGLALSVGVPFGIELFSDSSHRLQEVEKAVGLPGIGLIPLCNKADLENVVRSPVLDSQVPNFLLESFRIIRANIALNKMRDVTARVVMVTSARPGEGKTTQAANLAWAFSSVGDRTLIMDTDLRRGRIHKILGMDNEQGMTTLLAGRSSLTDVIRDTEVPNLDVITRGPVIPGSTELLCKLEFEKIIDLLKDRYERIILDATPVLGLSETASLQRVTDGVILVVRAEKTPKRDVRAAIEVLAKAGAYFYGFVLNAVDLSKPANYYNYYYYSSSYYDEFAEDTDADADADGGQLALPMKT